MIDWVTVKYSETEPLVIMSSVESTMRPPLEKIKAVATYWKVTPQYLSARTDENGKHVKPAGLRTKIQTWDRGWSLRRIKGLPAIFRSCSDSLDRCFRQPTPPLQVAVLPNPTTQAKKLFAMTRNTVAKTVRPYSGCSRDRAIRNCEFFGGKAVARKSIAKATYTIINWRF